MKAFVNFDAYVETYEVANEISLYRHRPGVQSVHLLERAVGKSPRYCVELDVDDESSEQLMKSIEAQVGQYSSYLSNVSWGAYKQVL